MLLAYLIWVIFSALHGVYDGIMYSHFDFSRPIEKGIKHPHVWGTLMRAVFLVALFFWIPDWRLSVSCILAFSFWHNGMYYEARRWWGGALTNFFSASKTSTSWGFTLFGRYIQPFELNFFIRTFLKCASLALMYRLIHDGIWRVFPF